MPGTPRRCAPRSSAKGSASAPRRSRPRRSVVAPVGVHRLAEQDHLAHAARRRAPGPRRGSRRGAADLAAARARHDAEAAEEVAALHHRDVGAARRRGRRRPRCRAGRSKRSRERRLLGARGALAAPAPRRRGPARRRRLWVPKAKSRWAKRRSRVSPSCCATQPPTPRIRPARARLPGAQRAEVAVEAVLGLLADRAGVHEQQVGRLGVRALDASRRAAGGSRASPSRGRSSGSRRCARGSPEGALLPREERHLSVRIHSRF